MYIIEYSPKAEEDLAKLKANEPKFFDKAVKLLNELMEHPAFMVATLKIFQKSFSKSFLPLTLKKVDADKSSNTYLQHAEMPMYKRFQAR